MEEKKVGKSRWKSKTNWVAIAIGVIGVLETNLGMLREVLGEWYGVTYVGIAAVMFALREITKEPVV